MFIFLAAWGVFMVAVIVYQFRAMRRAEAEVLIPPAVYGRGAQHMSATDRIAAERVARQEIHDLEQLWRL